MTRFAVVAADPPWQFDDRLPGRSRGAERNYPCMPVSALERLILPPIADNAVLLLWRVAAMQEEALRIVRAWGFTLKSELVWVKTTKRASVDAGATKLAFGMGRQVRAAHEVCLIATRGKVRPLVRNQRSVFFAPRARHSEKPDAFYEIAERTWAGPRVELFARRERENWTTYGNEIGTELEVRAA